MLFAFCDLAEGVGAHEQQDCAANDFERTVETFDGDGDLEGVVERARERQCQSGDGVGAVVNQAAPSAKSASVITARPCLTWCFVECAAWPGKKLGRSLAVFVKYRTPTAMSTIATATSKIVA